MSQPQPRQYTGQGYYTIIKGSHMTGIETPICVFAHSPQDAYQQIFGESTSLGYLEYLTDPVYDPVAEYEVTDQ